MTWSGRRRFLIIAIVAAVIIAVLAFVLEAIIYQAPSCADIVQNQGEQGVDCGGPCQYLCTEQQTAPVVRFTKTLMPSANRTDIIAYVDNPNQTAAAKNVPYTITLYASDHTVLKKGTGTIDLPPAKSVPIFLPSFFNGRADGAQAFVTIDPAAIRWFTLAHPPASPTVVSPTLGGTITAPRITATLSNPTTVPFSYLPVIAVVFDSAGNVIAASQTVIPKIAGQGSVEATFTWFTPFSATPARIDVSPLVPLPAPAP